MNRPKRYAGVEDGSFEAFPKTRGEHTIFCCVVMLEDRIDDVLLSRIEVDGLDATEKLLAMLKSSSVDVVLLGGITFAGFNVVDVHRVLCERRIPVIVVSREEPDIDSMLSALKGHFDDWEQRWRAVMGLGEIHRTVSKVGEPPIYYEVLGESPMWAEEILRSSCIVSRVPEPVRVARIIARGISRSY